jgi:hypothetical protein
MIAADENHSCVLQSFADFRTGAAEPAPRKFCFAFIDWQQMAEEWKH